jgi:hypothetical protein
MLKKTSIVLAATMGIVVGAVSVHAQEPPPVQTPPRGHMMMQDMQNMHAQMSKMMEGVMQPSSSPQKK